MKNNMDTRFIQGQPVVVLERFADGSASCCAVSTGRGLAFQFIAEADMLVPEETNNSAGADVRQSV